MRAAAIGRLLACELLPRLKALKQFQMRNMYRHPRVMASMSRAQGVVTDLFGAFVADPGLLPADWAMRRGPGNRARWRGTILPA